MSKRSRRPRSGGGTVAEAHKLKSGIGDVTAEAHRLPDGSMQIVVSSTGHAGLPWWVLQKVKNEVAGPEREAVEIYPAESRCVRDGNARHLFVLPEGQRFPFGLTADEIADEIRRQEG